MADIREIEDFALGEDLDPLGGQIIDFHPSQNLTPEQANMHARENADTEKDVVNDDKQVEETEEDSYESEIARSTEAFDPLLEDKQYLVTMIVT